MVYFSCSGCNESLKKNKVANHLNMCRRCHVLTCIDCQKDFDSTTYIKHNQCMTEIQRYGGPGYVQPDNANKGQKKQMGWMDSVHAAIEAFVGDCSNRNKKDEQILLTGLQKYDNIPRKKAKFMNFVKSSFGRYRQNEPLISTVWEVISKPTEEANQNQANQNTNGKIPDNVNTVSAEKVKEEEQSKVPDEEEEEYKSKRERKKERKQKHAEEDDEEDASGRKKKKKRKHEEEQEKKPVIDEEPKKKKKKKRKHEEEVEPLEEVEEEQEQGPVSDEEPRKKKKKKKRHEEVEQSDEDEEVMKNGEISLSDQENQDTSQQEAAEENNNESIVEDEDTDSRKRKKKLKKRKREEENGLVETPPEKRSKKGYVPEGFRQERLNETLEAETPKKFVIANAITAILDSKGEGGIPMKKLEKKVLSEYTNSLKEGQLHRPEKIAAKMKTIISKHFRLVNDRVYLRPEI